jgi:hypothetical protein
MPYLVAVLVHRRTHRAGDDELLDRAPSLGVFQGLTETFIAGFLVLFVLSQSPPPPPPQQREATSAIARTCGTVPPASPAASGTSTTGSTLVGYRSVATFTTLA